jgi:hypothetical protein
MPSWKALASVAALGLIGTSFATLILYRMLNTYGSSRTSLVTYLLPPMALFYGVTILDEQIHLNAGARARAHPRGRRPRLGALQDRRGAAGTSPPRRPHAPRRL